MPIELAWIAPLVWSLAALAAVMTLNASHRTRAIPEPSNAASPAADFRDAA